jgi:hypothetical protein
MKSSDTVRMIRTSVSCVSGMPSLSKQSGVSVLKTVDVVLTGEAEAQSSEGGTKARGAK